MLKTVSSITNAIGALNYKGTWNANTNTPALASGVGTKGDYYVVSVAGTTTLDGISNWGVGDWATFNGSVWQRVEGGADGEFVNLSATGTSTLATVDINGGAVDGTAVGASAPSSGRFTSPLLTNATSASGMTGDAVHRLSDVGVISMRGLNVTASTGTVDFALAPGGNGYQGFLSVASTATATANRRRQTTFSVFGRGTDSSIQQIATDAGVLGGVTFTITTPTDGVIRFTNTAAEPVDVYMQFFGGISS